MADRLPTRRRWLCPCCGRRELELHETLERVADDLQIPARPSVRQLRRTLLEAAHRGVPGARELLGGGDRGPE